MSTKPMRGPSIIIDFPTAELEAIRDLLQNETRWDRDADTAGFNKRVKLPVHKEAEWNLLNSAMLRIDIELERRKQRQEEFDHLFPAQPETPTSQSKVSRVTYLIDGQEVPKDKFEAFCKGDTA